MPRLVGINHVALEVGDVDEALDFYGGLFEFELRGRVPGMAFIDIGDQFLALAEAEPLPRGDQHFGLVVDDKEAIRQKLADAGVEPLTPRRGLAFRDPWGNEVEVVQYSDIQFTKAPDVLDGMRLSELEKSKSAIEELREKGLAD